jgi:tRNA nucleotidyltransferase (CCA-adding enzyme)
VLDQNEIIKLRDAAEKAWSEHSRHSSMRGHPDPSAGQCYVTSKWLQSRLGGRVGRKHGHYFWITPDDQYALDLTGDLYSRAPVPEELRGVKVDDEDEHGFQHRPDQMVHTPGSPVFKRLTHSVYEAPEVVEGESEQTGERWKAFAQKADRAYENQHTADYGGQAYPGETPQALADQRMRDDMYHDDLSEPASGEFNFVYAHGRLHVSPDEDPHELARRAGVDDNHRGPLAAGHVSVVKGRSTWSVASNVGLNGLHRVLEDYSKKVGWTLQRLTDSDGHSIDDRYAAARTIFLDDQETGERISVEVHGKTASTAGLTDEQVDAVREAGYKIADYPGGGNMLDKMKSGGPWGETLETFDQNAMQSDFTQTNQYDKHREPSGAFKCPVCNRLFPNSHEYGKHRREEEPIGDERSGFPEVPEGLGSRDWSQQQAQEGIGSEGVIARRATPSEAARFAGHNEWELPGGTKYAAFYNGQVVGVAARVRETLRYISARTPGAFRALADAYLADVEHPSTDDPALASRLGMVKQGDHYRLSDKAPKDQITAPLPFIYDLKNDKIVPGHQGTRTSDIPGEFSPGEIVEGYYEPGGKVTLTTRTNAPFSIRHLLDLWYYSFPHMELTGLSQRDVKGNEKKLAATPNLRPDMTAFPAAAAADRALRAAGGDVWVVGGYVRDRVMGKAPKDMDLMVTGLGPEQVKEALAQVNPNVDITGKDFGVFRLHAYGDEVEVALPRTEKSTGDRRVDFDVQVDPHLPVEKDLERRDLTANSIAVNTATGEVKDPFGGQKDIQDNVMRTTHPNAFVEDPTRMVRAMAAASRFGYEPSDELRAQMHQHGHRLTLESPERIRAELDKLFAGDHPSAGINLAHETGALDHIFPEVSATHGYDQGNKHHNLHLYNHLMEVLDRTAKLTKDPDTRLAALLHDIGKPASRWDDEAGQGHYYKKVLPDGTSVGQDHGPVGGQMARDRMDALTYPKARTNRVGHLIDHHMWPKFDSPRGARKFLARVGNEHADDLMLLRVADQSGKGKVDMPEYLEVERQRELVEQARQQNAPVDVSRSGISRGLAVSGRDLQALGMTPGPAMGDVLRALSEEVIDNPELNNPQYLLTRAKTLMGV